MIHCELLMVSVSTLPGIKSIFTRCSRAAVDLLSVAGSPRGSIFSLFGIYMYVYVTVSAVMFLILENSFPGVLQPSNTSEVKQHKAVLQPFPKFVVHFCLKRLTDEGLEYVKAH